MYLKEKNKRLCEEMPYLIPKNVFSGKAPEDYDYSYIVGDYSIPEGWHNLFIQMCRDIREPLAKAGYLDEFIFSQVKEKYAKLNVYHFGAPTEVCNIIDKYEHISAYICEKCGKPATKKSCKGWIDQYCDECAKQPGTKKMRILILKTLNLILLLKDTLGTMKKIIQR